MLKVIEKYGIPLLEIVLGILFIFEKDLPWLVLYIAVISYCCLQPILWLVAIIFSYKPLDGPDIPVIIVNLLFAGILVARPSIFLNSLYFFLAIWLLCKTLLSFIDCYVLKNDKQLGIILRVLQGVFSLLLSLGLLHQNFPLLSLFIGLFFIFEGLRILLETYIVEHPSSYLAKHQTFSISTPVFFSIFTPIHTYVTLQATSLPKQDTSIQPDMWIHLYVRGKGFETLGHMDISYQGTIYSYGCHDPQHRTLGGSLGDGVLIECNESQFLESSLQNDKKSIISYGLSLTKQEKQKLENKIGALKERAIPWHCAYETDSHAKDYASRLYKKTHCHFYKFTKGKFKTYFVATTNCVLLADSLIHTKDFKLLFPAGFITPGNYLTFLEKEYNTTNNKVIAKVVHTAHEI